MHINPGLRSELWWACVLSTYVQSEGARKLGSRYSSLSTLTVWLICWINSRILCLIKILASFLCIQSRKDWSPVHPLILDSRPCHVYHWSAVSISCITWRCASSDPSIWSSGPYGPSDIGRSGFRNPLVYRTNIRVFYQHGPCIITRCFL